MADMSNENNWKWKIKSDWIESIVKLINGAAEETGWKKKIARFRIIET